MPGGGKSTVGRELARRLAMPFADCDRAIESQVACSIATFFAQHGESAFREVETQVLSSLLSAGPSVIATGGGIVLRPPNRELLRESSVCVFLEASHDLLWRRLRRDRRRPLLQVAEPESRLREMSAEREPLYRETAQLVIKVDGLTFERVADEVMRRVAADEGR